MNPEIYVEPVPGDSSYSRVNPPSPYRVPFRVVARVGRDVGDVYLHRGTKEECQGVMSYLSRVAESGPTSLRALLRALGRHDLAEQIRELV